MLAQGNGTPLGLRLCAIARRRSARTAGITLLVASVMACPSTHTPPSTEGPQTAGTETGNPLTGHPGRLLLRLDNSQPSSLSFESGTEAPQTFLNGEARLATLTLQAADTCAGEASEDLDLEASTVALSRAETAVPNARLPAGSYCRIELALAPSSDAASAITMRFLGENATELRASAPLRLRFEAPAGEPFRIDGEHDFLVSLDAALWAQQIPAAEAPAVAEVEAQVVIDSAQGMVTGTGTAPAPQLAADDARRRCFESGINSCLAASEAAALLTELAIVAAIPAIQGLHLCIEEPGLDAMVPLRDAAVPQNHDAAVSWRAGPLRLHAYIDDDDPLTEACAATQTEALSLPPLRTSAGQSYALVIAGNSDSARGGFPASAVLLRLASSLAPVPPGSELAVAYVSLLNMMSHGLEGAQGPVALELINSGGALAVPRSEHPFGSPTPFYQVASGDYAAAMSSLEVGALSEYRLLNPDSLTFAPGSTQLAVFLGDTRRESAIDPGPSFEPSLQLVTRSSAGTITQLRAFFVNP